MNKFILGILFLSLMSSCSKLSQNTHVDGTVVNIITKDGVDSVEVIICDGLRHTGYANNENCKTTFTDSNGNFSIDIKSRQATIYFSKPDYQFSHYAAGSVDGVVFLRPGKNNNETFEIEPLCAFAPYFYSPHATNQDTLIRNIGQNYRSIYTFYSNRDRAWYGKGPFKIHYFGDKTKIGDMHTLYKLRFTRNGVWNEIIDSVFLAQGEVFQDTILY